MSPRLTGAACGAALALVSASAADAATLIANTRCAIDKEPVTYRGAGFTPGARWDIEAFAVFKAGDVGADGTFTTAQEAPLYTAADGGSKLVTVNAHEAGVTGNPVVASVSYRIASTYARGTNVAGNPRGHTRWTFSGWTPGKKLYVHVSHRGHTYTSRIGRTHGACGTLRLRLRKLPGVPAGAQTSGKYKLVFDNHRKAGRKGHRLVSSYRIF